MAATFDTTRPDVCVIGAGLAGGLIAHALAEAGLSVLLVEAGRRFPRGDRLAETRRLFDDGVLPWAGPESRDRFTNAGSLAYPLNEFRVKGVGGTTLHWTAYTPRFVEADFRPRQTHGVGEDWPITYADLSPFYDAAEHELGVSGIADNPFAAPRASSYPLEGFPYAPDDHALAEACGRLGIRTHHAPFARGTVRWRDRSPCYGYATCASHQICPISAQYTAETHVQAAEATGRVELLTEHRVRRMEVNASGHVEAVVCRGPDGGEVVRAARLFVLCAHAVETARLLLLSTSSRFPHGLANGSGLVGRHFMEHQMWAVSGRVARRMRPYQVGFHTMDSHAFCDTATRGASAGFRLAFPNAQGPRPEDLARDSGQWGDRLAREVASEFGRTATIHAFTESLPDARNTVTLDPALVDDAGDPVPRLTYASGEYERAGGRQAVDVMHRILDACGATDITAYDGVLFCGHQIGTCRMGARPDTSVVDAQLVCHDVPNLAVVGSSVFPTASVLNPSLTIAALALRAARHLPSLL